MQRIPRYELLLKELLKNTPEDHPDHTPIMTALEEVKRVANILNEKNREQKSRCRMLEVQKLIGDGVFLFYYCYCYCYCFILISLAEVPDLIQPYRVLIEEGNVLQMPAKHPLTVFLFNDIIHFGSAQSFYSLTNKHISLSLQSSLTTRKQSN